MDIVILSNFCMDFSESDNDRFLYIAKKVSSNHTVEIITSDFFHAKKEKRDSTPVKWPFKITFLKEPGYSKNVCFRRFYSHFVWGLEVKKYLKTRKKPDVIYCAVPSLTGAYIATQYSIHNGIKFVIDVQDLWPEAFKMVFNIPFISNIIFSPFKFIADAIYRNADGIVAVSQTYVDRVLKVNNKCESGLSVFLGTDLEVFDKNKQNGSSVKKENGDIWIGYCGTLGTSYDLKCVIDAMDILNDNRTKFVVLGDGPLKKEFEEYAIQKNVDASFLGRLPYDTMCSVLGECDIVVNPIIGTSVASIINKHADYAAVGRAVINTQNSKEYIELINKYQMGYSVAPGNCIDFSEKLKILVDDENLRFQMGNNARRCAEECFDRRYTYSKIVELICS